MRIPVVAVLLVLLGASGALGQEKTDDGFVVIDANICEFRLNGYELREPIKEAIVFGARVILETYGDVFGFTYPEDVKLKLTIFGDQQEFKKYQESRTGNVTSETGYYHYEYNKEGVVTYSEVVVWKNKKTSKMIGVMFHEISHLLLGQHVIFCPEWLDEGLAEYFEGLEVIGPKKRIFLQEWRSKWCKHWLKNGFPMEAKEYICLSRDQWKDFRQKNSNAAYTIGYSFVYFLMSRRNTQKVLRELLWEFKTQGKNTDSIGTINKHYPGGYKKFEKMWRRWIPRARPYRPVRVLRKRANQKARSSAKAAKAVIVQGNVKTAGSDPNGS